MKYNAKSGGTSESIREIACALRQEMTPQERKLWTALRNRNLDGIKVRRQFPIGRFILDFYIPESRLGIEIDGNVHADNVERDLERSATLRAINIQLIRFTNDQVDSNIIAVLEAIVAAAKVPNST